jgi:hypothetical protein
MTKIAHTGVHHGEVNEAHLRHASAAHIDRNLFGEAAQALRVRVALL